MDNKMETKIFDLLEKVYIDLNEVKKETKENSNHIIRLENEISNKLGILFDANKTTNDRLDRIENKLEEVSNKIDRHDIKIQVIEGGKKKKTL